MCIDVLFSQYSGYFMSLLYDVHWYNREKCTEINKGDKFVTENYVIASMNVWLIDVIHALDIEEEIQQDMIITYLDYLVLVPPS